jgi:mannose-6-phosphate isomerase-like protein (cupin superfamily)
MNVKKVVNEINRKYPRKKVIMSDPKDPGEIICETKPGNEKSEAISVIDYTKPHYHKKLTEVYKVIKGELNLTVDGMKKVVSEGESITIKPGAVHTAKGNETWVKVYSKPGWTPEDHFLLE